MTPEPNAKLEVAAGPSPAVRSLLSLLLFIHFFCVLVVLSSTYIRSRLQGRLVAIFGPYTQLLAFDPGTYTPFYYTHGMVRDDDAVIEIDLYPDVEQLVARQGRITTERIPGDGSRWLDQHHRGIALGKRLAFYGDPEIGDEEVSSRIVRSIGARMMREENARGALVRSVRRLSQPLRLATLFPEFPRDDPAAPEYDQVLYEAEVWIDEDGEVQANRTVAAAEAAPRRTGTRDQRSEVRGQETQQGAPRTEDRGPRTKEAGRP
jgi:hypothetical protein